MAPLLAFMFLATGIAGLGAGLWLPGCFFLGLGLISLGFCGKIEHGPTGRS